jgi:DNA-binding GntR family transcriptional regulator
LKDCDGNFHTGVLPDSNHMQAKVTSRTQAAYERIQSDIVAGHLLPGARLKIDDLCKSLGVSLGAVREALSRLTADGLVVSQPQRGFLVSPISASDLKDLTMVRCEIEAMCLRRAIALGDVAWESEVLAGLHRITRTPATDANNPKHYRDDWAEMHDEFHDTLVAPCDSPWLLRIRSQLFLRSTRYRRLSGPFGKRDRDVNAEHTAIVEAVLARDEAAAVARMSEHIQATTDILLASKALWSAETEPSLAG